MIEFTLILRDAEAMALAQLVKRFTHDDAVRFANPHVDGERDAMLEGILALQQALAEAGYAPR